MIDQLTWRDLAIGAGITLLIYALLTAALVLASPR